MNEGVHNIARQLTADKKKLGLMLGLGCVGLLLWGRLLFQSNVKTATADPKIGQTTDPGLSYEGLAITPPALSQDMGWNTADQSNAAVTVRVDAPNRLSRDLFNWRTGAYRRVENADETTQPRESPQPKADREFRIAQVRQAAKPLTLESVIGGQRPAAIINGQVLRQGQTIKSFTVQRIAKRYVILEMKGIRLRLRM